MRVLLSAFACSPVLGSEPGAGWAWASAAAEQHDCHLIVHDSSVKALDEALLERPDLTMTVYGLGDPRWLLTMGRQFVRLRHAVWQMRARHLSQRLHAELPFQVLHHLTLSSDWQPAGLAGVRGPAFVWGPVGGGTPTPPRLLRWLGPRGLAIELARRLIGGLGRRRYGDSAAARASVVLCQNAEVAKRFGAISTVHVEPNVALSRGWLEDTAPADVESLFQMPTERTACYVGRLLAWKGLALALAALARPAADGWSFLIVGAGPDQARLEGLVEKLGLSSRVLFAGQLSRGQVRAVFQEANALLFPSLHEGAGWVVAEAMALGCPVIALDHAGPAALIPRDGGTLVPIGHDMPGRFARALMDTTRRVPPLRAWDAARLPDLLSSTYAEAVAAHADGTVVT